MPPKVPKPPRCRDDKTFLSEFANELLVVCARCARCACIICVTDLPSLATMLPRRFVCASCGLTHEIGREEQLTHTDLNQVFGYPLYLSVRCAGNLLWAYNYRHLAWLERYVRATLRESRRDPKWGWSNASAASRLPVWIKSAKNRQEILRGIAKIQRGNTSVSKPIE